MTAVNGQIDEIVGERWEMNDDEKRWLKVSAPIITIWRVSSNAAVSDFIDKDSAISRLLVLGDCAGLHYLRVFGVDRAQIGAVDLDRKMVQINA